MPTLAESAAETDTKSYTQEADARTDPVPPPAAPDEPLSGITPKASQEQTQEGPATPTAEKTAPAPVSSSKDSFAGRRLGIEDLAKSLGDRDYRSARSDPAEEASVVDLATRFNEIQMIMGKEKATGIRWQKSLIGFRMLLFSDKHRRSYADAGLVLDHLKDNPMRAKEIVNTDKKGGVTNTYQLMFLFDRLYNEAVGRKSEAEKMFSKRKVRIPDSAHSASSHSPAPPAIPPPR